MGGLRAVFAPRRRDSSHGKSEGARPMGWHSRCGSKVEWWVYAILVILFFGFFGRGEPQSRFENPPPSQPAAGEACGRKAARARFALGLKWKRNPGNRWERERRRHSAP